MSRSARLLAPLLVILGGLSSCSAKDTETGGTAAQTGCVPGQKVSCTCSGQDSGEQTCGANRKFGACECVKSDAGAGGSPPDAGGDGGGPLKPPTLLASNQPAPRDLTVDDDNVYWTSAGNNNVTRCARAGCGGVPTALAAMQPYPLSITVSSGLVLWTNLGLSPDGGVGNGSVVRIAATDVGGMPLVVSSGQVGPDVIAADPNFVYWSVQGAVKQCDLLVCQSAITLADDTAQGVAIDAVNVYWASNTTTGTVSSCAIGGCAKSPKLIAENQGMIRGIASFGSSIYWATSSEVRSCPISGCPVEGPTTLAAGQSIVALRHPIATDGVDVYWGSGSEIVRCATSGCGGKPSVIAKDQTAPTAIVVKDDSVFWIDGDSIKYVIKP